MTALYIRLGSEKSKPAHPDCLEYTLPLACACWDSLQSPHDPEIDEQKIYELLTPI